MGPNRDPNRRGQPEKEQFLKRILKPLILEIIMTTLADILLDIQTRVSYIEAKVTDIQTKVDAGSTTLPVDLTPVMEGVADIQKTVNSINTQVNVTPATPVPAPPPIPTP